MTLAEQRILALKRELEGRPAAGSGTAASAASGASSASAFSAPLDSLTYVGFEDRFRGSQDDIRTRVEDYLPILDPPRMCWTSAAAAVSCSISCAGTA